MTDYVGRLENTLSKLKAEYANRLDMVDKAQHLRERLYQGLRLEIPQIIAPVYEDIDVPHLVLINRDWQIEAELPLPLIREP